MRNCFVPHCDAFCKKNGIIKRMMFSAPKDNFENWKKKLFNKREFRETDRVCERHFDSSQILTHWEHIIDGKLCQLEREKPKIKSDTIPYLNIPETEEIAQLVNGRRAPRETKKRKRTANDLEDNQKNTKSLHDDGIEFESNTEFETIGIENKTTAILSRNAANGRTRAKTVPKLSDDEKRQIFDTVYDDIYEVVLPSTLWGIHRDPEERQFIAFTLFDANVMKCSIVVKITDTFALCVHVNGVEKTKNTLNELSVDNLSKMLIELNESIDLGS